jgi:hypothetical protein
VRWARKPVFVGCFCGLGLGGAASTKGAFKSGLPRGWLAGLPGRVTLTTWNAIGIVTQSLSMPERVVFRVGGVGGMGLDVLGCFPPGSTNGSLCTSEM